MNFIVSLIVGGFCILVIYMLVALFGYDKQKIVVFDAVNPQGRRVGRKELEIFTNRELKEQLRILEERKIFILSTDNRSSKHLQALKEIERSWSIITSILHESEAGSN